MWSESVRKGSHPDYCSNQDTITRNYSEMWGQPPSAVLASPARHWQRSRIPRYSPGLFLNSTFAPFGGRLNGNSTIRFSTGKRSTNSSGLRHGPIHLSFVLKKTHPLADE